MDLLNSNNITAKMETTCDCCDIRIVNEQNAYEYEPLGILVCEYCHEMLLNGPTEEDDLDELMADLTIS
jgi:hypothetical protein